MINKLPVTFALGVNEFTDPAGLTDGQIQGSPNLMTRTGGFPGLRPSLSFDRLVVPDYRPWDSSRYDGLVTPEKEYTQWARNWRPMRFLFSPIGGEVAAVLQARTAQDYVPQNGAVSSFLTTAQEQEAILVMLPGVFDVNGLVNASGVRAVSLGILTRCPSLFVFNGIIYGFGGASRGGRIEPVSGINPVPYAYFANEWNTPGNESFFPQQAAVVRDRVVYSVGPSVFWSDRNDPLQIRTSALTDGGIIVSGEELEDVTAISELSTSSDGSPVQSVCAVWTRTRCFLLLGEPIETTQDITEESNGALGSLQINRLNIEAGCVSQASVVKTPYGAFWVGKDDVWFMPSGALPVRVGTNIRPAIEAVPPGLQYRICAEYSDNYLKIVMPGDGDGPTGISPMTTMWCLDMNGGPPGSSEAARWWGPHKFVNQDCVGETAEPESGVWCLAKDVRGNGDGRVYALQTFQLGGEQGTSSEIYGMALCGLDQHNARDTGAPVKELRYWEPSTAYSTGDEVVPPPSTSDFRAITWVCSIAGTSDTIEPDWYGSELSSISIADGSVTWRPIYFNDGEARPDFIPKSERTANEVLFQLTSAEYALGDPMVDKLLDGAELAYWAQQATQLTYSTNPDQQTNSRILHRHGNSLDSGFGMTQRVWQRKLLTPQAGTRFHALTAVAQIQQDAGYIIVAGYNDMLQLVHKADNILSISIPAGYYASILEVWTAIRVYAQSEYGVTLGSTTDLDLGIARARFGLRDVGTQFSLGLHAYGILASYFGFTDSQVGTSNEADPTEFFFADDSFYRQQSTDIQIAGLNLRFGVFGRRPM